MVFVAVNGLMVGAQGHPRSIAVSASTGNDLERKVVEDFAPDVSDEWLCRWTCGCRDHAPYFIYFKKVS